MSSIDEIFYQCRADSIKNFIPAINVKTKQQVDNYNAQGFFIGYTANEFKEVFPKIPLEKIFYNNGFNKVYYYDSSKFIVFQINLYGRETITLNGDFQEEVLKAIEICENAFKNKHYYSLIVCLNDIMKFEIFVDIVLKTDFPNAYDVFLEIYTMSEYGFNLLTEEVFKKLQVLKTNKNKKETKNALNEYGDEICIYRGEGERSQKYTSAFSWTTDINIANFFATKMGNNNARIISAKVRKENVFEVGRPDEKELIIFPEKVYDVQITSLYELKDLEEIFPIVDYRYKKYKALIDKLKYGDGIHGKLHIYRVLLHALILAYYYDIEEKNVDILATACVWHDIGRTNEETDDLHGLVGAEKYKKETKNRANKDVYFLIKNHSVKDENALLELEEKYKKQEKKEKMKLLFKIIKDADGLDRIRIKDLDASYLRLNESKKMTLIARLLYEYIK